MIEPTAKEFERVDRMLGRAEIALAVAAACLLLALVAVIA